MSGTLIRIDAAGNRLEERYENKGPPTLEVLQRLVGGYVQMVKVVLDNRIRHAYVDEDGISKGLGGNVTASKLCLNSHQIWGPMVVWVPDPRSTKK